MGIKCVLATVPESAESVSPAIAAINIAKQFDGYAECLLMQERNIGSANPVPTVSYTGNPEAIVAAQEAAARRERQREQKLDGMLGDVRRVCNSRGVEFHDRASIPAARSARLPMASCRISNGNAGNEAVRRAQAFDLVITPAPGTLDGSKDFQEIAETALLESGRPIMLMPKLAPENLACHVSIAWEPSVPAWHAVSAAMPFLEHADCVSVVTVDHGRANGDSQGDLLAYLDMHGVEADARHVAQQGSVGDTLLAYAYDEEVDLMVMGGYAHSRLRERLLGGTTRHILQHAAAATVLLAH